MGLVGNFIRASRKSQFRYDKYFILGLVLFIMVGAVAMSATAAYAQSKEKGEKATEKENDFCGCGG